MYMHKYVITTMAAYINIHVYNAYILTYDTV